MKTKTLSLLTLISIILFSCGVVDTGGDLTEQKIENYIDVYQKLREIAPDILEQINKNPENSDIGLEKFSEIESVIKDGGFRSFADFVRTNAKIGAIFTVIQANSAMENYEDLNEWSNESFDSGIAEYEKLIADPNIPEENKKEYRQAIEELKKSQNEVNDDWDANKKWANLVLKGVNKIKGLIVSEEEIELVKKYEAEIYEVYTGIPQPELPDNKFPDITFDY